MIKFTVDELNEILSLIDLAVKFGGLLAAQRALPLVAKMQEMALEMQERPEAPETNEGHA